MKQDGAEEELSMDGLDRPKLCLTPQEHWCKKCTRFGPPEGKEADYFFNPCTGWSLALNSLWGRWEMCNSLSKVVPTGVRRSPEKAVSHQNHIYRGCDGGSDEGDLAGRHITQGS